MELPKVVEEINKSKKTTKITTLDKAKSFILKRMFSGSIAVDELTGGGFGYRRAHLIYGSKSSGKNALLYQTIAYNQRLCRNCHGIIPAFYGNSGDRHSVFLRYVLGMPECKCGDTVSKVFMILDYEKSLAVEDTTTVLVKKIFNNNTGEEISEDEYDAYMEELSILDQKSEKTDEEKSRIKTLHKWEKELTIETNPIIQLSAKDYLTKCGIFIEQLLVADPPDTEEGIEIVRNIIRSNEIDGIVWDSLQGSLPKYVKEREADQATMGAEAKANGLLMRHMCSAFSAYDLTDEKEAFKAALFITSQVRSSVGSFVPKPDTFSGGHSVAHIMSFILEVKRDNFIKEDGTDAAFKDSFFGQKIRVRAEKNKLAAPGDMYQYDYYFKDGAQFSTGQIDHISEIIFLGIQKGVIERAGSYYKISTGDQFQGQAKLVEYARQEPEFVGRIYAAIKRK